MPMPLEFGGDFSLAKEFDMLHPQYPQIEGSDICGEGFKDEGR
jgi:hypothetical protein